MLLASFYRAFVRWALPRLEAYSEWMYTRGRRVAFASWNGRIYFKRHYVLYPRPLNDSPDFVSQKPNIFLHHFPENSPDQNFHDHGAWCFGIVLVGGYIETVIEGGQKIRRTRRPGSMAFFRPGDVHQIKYCLPGTWTLFVLSRRIRATTFFKDDGITVVGRRNRTGARHMDGRQLDSPAFQKHAERRKKAIVRLRRRTCRTEEV